MSDYSIAMVDSRKGNIRGGTLTGGILYIAMGLLFIIPSIFDHEAVLLFLALPFGLIISLMGILAIRRARALPK